MLRRVEENERIRLSSPLKRIIATLGVECHVRMFASCRKLGINYGFELAFERVSRVPYFPSDLHPLPRGFNTVSEKRLRHRRWIRNRGDFVTSS